MVIFATIAGLARAEELLAEVLASIILIVRVALFNSGFRRYG